MCKISSSKKKLSSTWEPRVQSGEVEPTSVGQVVNFGLASNVAVANLEQSGKERPGSATAWFHIRTRISRRKSRDTPIIYYGDKPSLISQEMLFQQYLTKQKENVVVPVSYYKKARAKRTKRIIQDVETGKLAFLKLIPFVKEARDALTRDTTHKGMQVHSSNVYDSRNDVHSYYQWYLSKISMPIRKQTVLKRKYLYFSFFSPDQIRRELSGIFWSMVFNEWKQERDFNARLHCRVDPAPYVSEEYDRKPNGDYCTKENWSEKTRDNNAAWDSMYREWKQAGKRAAAKCGTKFNESEVAFEKFLKRKMGGQDFFPKY